MSRKKSLLYVAIIFCAFCAHAQSIKPREIPSYPPDPRLLFQIPVIGFDSFYHILFSKLTFSNAFFKDSQTAHLGFWITVDSNGKCKNVTQISWKEDMTGFADQTIEVIRALTWDRSVQRGLLQIEISPPLAYRPSSEISPKSAEDRIPPPESMGAGAMISDGKPAVKADIDATFIGGESKFFEYVRDNFNYPDRCLEEGIDGAVLLEFVVDVKGKISNVKAISETPACPEFTTEAIRVLKASPRWMPGQSNGTFVKSYRRIPIQLKATSE